MKHISLIILDIDGVLTDGKKYYGLDGIAFAKTYCDQDFTAIKRFRAVGLPVCFLSGDTRINENMAKNRNIDFYSSKGTNKAQFVQKLCKIYNTTPLQMVYVGDDLFDIDIMKLVGYPYCPSNSCADIKKICEPSNILKNMAGNNVVSELHEVLVRLDLIDNATLQQIEELDRLEIF